MSGHGEEKGHGDAHDGHGHDEHGHEQAHEEHEEHEESHDGSQADEIEHGHEEAHEGQGHDEGHKGHEGHAEKEHAKPKEEKKEKMEKIIRRKFSVTDIAILIIFAVVGRIILEPLPSVEPIIPIAVFAGLMYGADAGILVGLFSYPLSNIFMDGGPFGLWTFLQAIGGGLAGGIAGNAGKATVNNLVTYSVIGTVLFEFALNIPDQALLVWPFSVVHIVSNIIIALVLGELLIKEK